MERFYPQVVVKKLFGALTPKTKTSWMARKNDSYGTPFFVRLWLHRPRVFKARDLLNRSGLAC